MKQERILQVICAPHVTEKTSSAAAQKQLVFKVDRNSTKKEIKIAVEQLLEVRVIAINTVNMAGKVKRIGRRIGIRNGFKKAYVSLDKSVDIEALLSQQS